MTSKLSLLAVFAHPDDESCGAGATLAMYAHRGVEVTLLCATRGERGASGTDRMIAREEFGAVRSSELAQACIALGISRWSILGYPDGEVSLYETEVLMQDILLHVWQSRPQVMITNWPEGSVGHPDHDAVARATTAAFHHAGDTRFCEHVPNCPQFEPLKLYYTVPPDGDLARRLDVDTPLVEPEVTSYIDAKIRAMHHHVSQKQCAGALAEVVRRTPGWHESFRLAGSRVPAPEGPENDLFDGIPGAGGYERESERRPT